ncbi:MAG TPA: hypothetical protein VN794_02620, partial [Methylomirabilota bacterium]|nr:hypothetical protein [Methylomirabilota bacterium]
AGSGVQIHLTRKVNKQSASSGRDVMSAGRVSAGAMNVNPATKNPKFEPSKTEGNPKPEKNLTVDYQDFTDVLADVRN